ncbi:hypothetical protein HaLaN_20297 [Haematococcus lacustris]|uniref:Uncharacterized protein n=1 Tax=Haematococcus lacustris TaxID=44745 RepID=A0A699ZVS9_HAELA|nr:hypothetical protein HaLaN_20297 [Haematococcus lacustris]
MSGVRNANDVTPASVRRRISTLGAHIVHGVEVVLIARYSFEVGVGTRVQGQHSLRSCAGPRGAPPGRRQTAAELQAHVALRQVRDDRGLSWDILEDLLPVRKHPDPRKPASHHETQ